MEKEPEIWTVSGLLEYFMAIHRRMGDRSFAFILGAGASRPSGIPTGGELVQAWLLELHRRLDPQHITRPLRDWATAENLGIPDFDFDHADAFYPEVFERRFRDDPEEGYAYLETIMEGVDPSFGYSVLAQIVTNTRHRVIITTNFDNLVADALSIYTRTSPLICGHESLTGFVRAQLRRPLVAKIHRDLLLAPKSDPEEIAKLPPGWVRALRVLFQHHSPIVIGYGGNDGSLMGLLEELESGRVVGGIRWCYREGDDLPNERIRAVVGRHKGALVPIIGFDEFMLQLGEQLGLGLLAEEIVGRAKDRADRYRKSVEAIQRSVATPAEDVVTEKAKEDVRQALAATIERQKDWWAWELKASAEVSPEKSEQIYRQGLSEFPDSPELLTNFANFLYQRGKNYDEAERLYRRALEVGPNFVLILGNLATFLVYVRKNYDEAERLYRRALELEPNDSDIIGVLANFLSHIRKNYDEAERLYRRALELDPKDASHTGNFAAFLLARGRAPEGREIAKRAWKLNNAQATQLAAEVALYRGLMALMEGREDAPVLGRLKTLLAGGFERLPWSFEQVLQAAAPKLPDDDRRLYEALAAAILDADRVAALDSFARWKEVTPIALDVPWPMEGRVEQPPSRGRRST